MSFLGGLFKNAPGTIFLVGKDASGRIFPAFVPVDDEGNRLEAGLKLTYAEAKPSSTTYIQLIAAPGAGLRITLRGLLYVNASASTGRIAKIRFGAAGVEMFQLGMTVGNTVVVPLPGFLEGAENEALNCALTGGTGVTDTTCIALYTVDPI